MSLPWHRRLLNRMATAQDKRLAILSQEIAKMLEEYLSSFQACC